MFGTWMNSKLKRHPTSLTIFQSRDKRECGNYRGISLLSIPGKVFVLILLCRLSTLAEVFLLWAQCGFRANRGITDMISLRQIQEKHLLYYIC